MRSVFSVSMIVLLCSAAIAKPDLAELKVPPGFRIEYFASDVPDAREMALGAKGTLFVGSQDRGVVYAIVNNGVKASAVKVVARGLNTPNGVAFHAGTLYVAEINRILRLDDIEGKLDAPPKPVVVYDKLPSDRGHGWKFIAFGPDGFLYVPVGAPCNICEPDAQHASIFRVKPDGSAFEAVARGVRNTVGFDWDPADGKLWFSDNGRDMLGDDVPPCELNRLDKFGQNFGFPYCHGGTLADPEFGSKHACSEFVAPALNFGAHVAPLGLRFYTGTMFPAEYRGSIIIAQHGSWNRSKKSGYQVLRVPVHAGKAAPAQPFVTGWLKNESVSGRPVDILQMPDGAVLISDDDAGVIYRVSYVGGAK